MSSRYNLMLAGASLMALAGCVQTEEEIRLATHMHTQIVAEETTAELKLGGFAAADKLGQPERDAVKYFATAYRDEGHGAVVISRPSNGPDDIASLRAASDARAVLLAEGVDGGQIAEGTYDATGARAAPLIISYRTYNAVVPDCKDLSYWELTDTSSNNGLPSFGCAVASNLAAMIANPADLVGSHRMDGADSGRRLIVMSKYRSGEKTSSVRNTDANGAVSKVAE